MPLSNKNWFFALKINTINYYSLTTKCCDTYIGGYIGLTSPCLYKNSQNCFCHNYVKFLPTLIVFAKTMTSTIELYEVN